jgi:outer membrane lipoprotein-sorting protein
MTRSRRAVRRHSIPRSVAWTVPLATAAVIGGAVAVPMTASAGTPSLDSTTPEALLAAVRTADVPRLSGQVAETARLGLPEIAGQGDDASLSWQTLVTGTNTARIAVDGPERQRLALLGTLAESDVVHNGSDVWTYASTTREATHVVLPADLADRAGATASADPADPMNMTPLGAAQYVLGAITPTTGVSLAENTQVAGQDAYTLVLTPEQAGSTISRVVIAVDAIRYVPLRVQVFGTGGTATDAVFETGFTSISYDRPSAATFDFAVPAGATVTTHQVGEDAAGGTYPTGPAAPQVLGSGWTSVVAYAPDADALAALAPGAQDSDSTADLLNRLVTVQPNGDRLLSTALVNVLLTADGQMFAGAVQPSVLQQAAATR